MKETVRWVVVQKSVAKIQFMKGAAASDLAWPEHLAGRHPGGVVAGVPPRLDVASDPADLRGELPRGCAADQSEELRIRGAAAVEGAHL